MRYLLAAVLIVVGCLLAILSWGPLQNLVSDDGDSPVWVYLVYGIPLLALAFAAFAGGARLLR